jgi:hypothetical protein
VIERRAATGSRCASERPPGGQQIHPAAERPASIRVDHAPRSNDDEQPLELATLVLSFP